MFVQASSGVLESCAVSVDKTLLVWCLQSCAVSVEGHCWCLAKSCAVSVKRHCWCLAKSCTVSVKGQCWCMQRRAVFVKRHSWVCLGMLCCVCERGTPGLCRAVLCLWTEIPGVCNLNVCFVCVQVCMDRREEGCRQEVSKPAECLPL